MRVIELFAGAGGAALGLERAGFSHAWLVSRAICCGRRTRVRHFRQLARCWVLMMTGMAGHGQWRPLTDFAPPGSWVRTSGACCLSTTLMRSSWASFVNGLGALASGSSMRLMWVFLSIGVEFLHGLGHLRWSHRLGHMDRACSLSHGSRWVRSCTLMVHPSGCIDHPQQSQQWASVRGRGLEPIPTKCSALRMRFSWPQVDVG